jgi:hypothetical protein
MGEDMQVPAVVAAAGLVLVAVSVTACSGGPKTAAAAPAAATTKASGSTRSAGSPAGSSSATKFNVCTALPAAAASQITGTTFTKTKSGDVKGLIFSCEYDGPNSALLQISVQTSYGKDGFNTDVSALKTVGHAPNSVTGVGDEAFSEPDPKGNAGSVGASSFASFGAVFGDSYIQIGGLTYVTASQGTQIVNRLHSKL